MLAFGFGRGVGLLFVGRELVGVWTASARADPRFVLHGVGLATPVDIERSEIYALLSDHGRFSSSSSSSTSTSTSGLLARRPWHWPAARLRAGRGHPVSARPCGRPWKYIASGTMNSLSCSRRSDRPR